MQRIFLAILTTLTMISCNFIYANEIVLLGGLVNTQSTNRASTIIKWKHTRNDVTIREGEFKINTPANILAPHEFNFPVSKEKSQYPVKKHKHAHIMVERGDKITYVIETETNIVDTEATHKNNLILSYFCRNYTGGLQIPTDAVNIASAYGTVMQVDSDTYTITGSEEVLGIICTACEDGSMVCSFQEDLGWCFLDLNTIWYYKI